VFRAAVDAVARHCAKLTAHSDSRPLEKLLTESPNAYMSSYDMLYRIAAAYFINNNAFAIPKLCQFGPGRQIPTGKRGTGK